MTDSELLVGPQELIKSPESLRSYQDMGLGFRVRGTKKGFPKIRGTLLEVPL